jgi:hypothetical protein
LLPSCAHILGWKVRTLCPTLLQAQSVPMLIICVYGNLSCRACLSPKTFYAVMIFMTVVVPCFPLKPFMGDILSISLYSSTIRQEADICFFHPAFINITYGSSSYCALSPNHDQERVSLHANSRRQTADEDYHTVTLSAQYPSYLLHTRYNPGVCLQHLFIEYAITVSCAGPRGQVYSKLVLQVASVLKVNTNLEISCTFEWRRFHCFIYHNVTITTYHNGTSRDRVRLY